MSNEELQTALSICEEKRQWQRIKIEKLLALTVAAKPKPSREPYLEARIDRLERRILRLLESLKRRDIEKKFADRISKKFGL